MIGLESDKNLLGTSPHYWGEVMDVCEVTGALQEQCIKRMHCQYTEAIPIWNWRSPPQRKLSNSRVNSQTNHWHCNNNIVIIKIITNVTNIAQPSLNIASIILIIEFMINVRIWITRSSWVNCALQDEETVYWVSVAHYEAVAVSNWWSIFKW